MTDSETVKLAPCPNPECSGGPLRMAQRAIPLEDFMFIWCEGCGTEGPCAQFFSEAKRLWNALPRSTPSMEEAAGETVKLADVERENELLRSALKKIAHGDGVYGAQAGEYKQIARDALFEAARAALGGSQ